MNMEEAEIISTYTTLYNKDDKESLATILMMLGDKFNENHQLQTLNELKKEMLLENDGAVSDVALQRGDLEGVFAALNFLDWRNKDIRNETGEHSKEIETHINRFLIKLNNYTDSNKSNILQMAILHELDKSADNFSDNLPKQALSWLKRASETRENAGTQPIKTAILHLNKEKNSSLHLSAQKPSIRFFVYMVQNSLKGDLNLHEYLDEQNREGKTPLTIAVKQGCLDQVALIAVLERYSPEALELKVMAQIQSVQETTLDLIITKGYINVMKYLLDKEKCRVSLGNQLNDCKFQDRLRNLTFTVEMRDLILEEAVTDKNLRIDFAGLITPRTSDDSRMHAIVFLDQENASRSDAHRIMDILQKINFNVQVLHPNQWDKGQLIDSLRLKLKDLVKTCTKLLVAGITHGEDGSVIDSDGKRIPVSEIESTIKNSKLSPYTDTTLIFDMCQNRVASREGSKTKVAPARQVSQDSSIMKVFSCSPGEQANAKEFIPELCKRLTSAQEPADFYEILRETVMTLESLNENPRAFIIHDQHPNIDNAVKRVEEMFDGLKFTPTRITLYHTEAWDYKRLRAETVTNLLSIKGVCRRIMLVGIHNDSRPLQSTESMDLETLVSYMQSWASNGNTDMQKDLKHAKGRSEPNEVTRVLTIGFSPDAQLADGVGTTGTLLQLTDALDKLARADAKTNPSNTVGSAVGDLFRDLQKICFTEDYEMRYREYDRRMRKPVTPKMDFPTEARKVMLAKPKKDNGAPETTKTGT